MLRTRFFVLLLGFFTLASASWADGTGYVDCAKFPGNAQVLDKAGMTSGAVAFIPCGERFTILVRGEFFTQIQTKDGKVGYLNTYMVTPDLTAPKPQQSKPTQTSTSTTASLAQLSAADKFKIISTTPSTPSVAAQASTSNASAPAPAPAPVAAQPTASAPVEIQASASTPAPSVNASAPSTQPIPAATAVQSQPAAAQPAPVMNASAPNVAADQPKPSVPESQPAPISTPTATTPAPAASRPPVVAPPAQTESPATAPVTAASAPASSSTASSADAQPTVPGAQPEPPAAQPEPPAAQPQPEPIHPKVMASQIKPRREKNPSPYESDMGVPAMEVFAGYGFTRFGGGNGTNLNGALGSFGWNFKPWLQIIGDASYNFVTVSGTKSVLYGNHFGPRIYLRSRTSRGPVPFVEGLVGGSRIDVTTAGVTASQNGLSYKAGGGVDIAISRLISVRAIEADYYRVPFLTASQTNYVASAGVIFRFGGRPRF
ncbi:MAG TPA: hypothetical protein VGS15_00445 [Candidatus Acidoferrales bacterium]|nr:hypothetical protein [Candidatus Acidoferrales bacterium]